MRVITIGGNIGCGKTTVLSNLSKEWTVFKEPLEKWGSWLDLFYTNPQRYAFSFQMKILHDFLYFTPAQKRSDDLLITERSPLDSLYVFCKTLKDSKTITHMEYNLFKEYVDTIGWKPDTFVYLRTDPETCIQRMRERARECETGVDDKYIRQIHDAYENFVNVLQADPDITVHVIDANVSADQVYATIKQKIDAN
jgi:deoxyadenosine/deoxycytidine kinase